MDLAKQLLAKNNWLIFDTETTGLDNNAQICQIGLLAADGTILMDKLVRPTVPIEPEATRVHGISDADVTTHPPIWRIESELQQLMEGKDIVVYNAPYDNRLLIQSFQVFYKLPDPNNLWPKRWFNNLDYVDIMIPYAKHHGKWNHYHRNYAWQSLTEACKQQKIPVVNAHNAIGDCQMTLALINALGGSDNE